MNVMIHFMELEPTYEDLDDPIAYLKNLDNRIREASQNMEKMEGKYKVKIIDYGFSRKISPL